MVATRTDRFFIIVANIWFPLVSPPSKQSVGGRVTEVQGPGTSTPGPSEGLFRPR